MAAVTVRQLAIFPVDAGYLRVDATTADERLHVQRATPALDVWQFLLHYRWQFRDVTFYRLQLGSESHADESVSPR
ncbi:hypothetical protein BG74_07145 [Sodalis-like endosymbiont of Proechinophthirus fluctus]|uniref:hypothetical protein n=1 Tax=Sodalis-like endosymbiont of Proechinophthirus fluctus TaxID=1462730 RepID=UPI0007A9228A|nr:hypothetical protein [Sodalis-like endosymbiont of Proechinophthirus fluctus]KYP96661.1 hypothetical protein BG74_07145 [Sodalis-like endosymbiont of Proechinophthirus fluctus]